MAADRSPPGPDQPAGELLQRRLVAQVAALRRHETAARTGDADGVHRARVACDRLRCALKTYRPLVDAALTGPVDAELGWLRGLLGEVRDAQVAHVRLRKLVVQQAPDPGTGAVLERLDLAYTERGRATSAALVAGLDSDRHEDLQASLSALVDDPPWSSVAGAPARAVLPGRVLRAWRQLDRQMEAVEAAPDRGEALHQVRRRAKRLRYAVETLEPAWGADARRLGRATAVLTAHLGEYQDTVVSRRDLLALAAVAEAAGEDPSVWLDLAEREAEGAAALDRHLPGVWAGLSRKRLRRWLR